MRRTLNVIDQPGQAAEAAVLKLSVDTARFDPASKADQHAWLLFGGQATRDAAHAVGLRDEQFRLLPKPVGLHQWLPAALNKPKQLFDQAHRVVCWTEGAAQIASLVACAHVTRHIQHATLCPFAQHIITQAHHASHGHNRTDRDTIRKQWGVAQGTTVVAFIGDRFDQSNAADAMMVIVSAHEALYATQPDRAEVRLLCHPLSKGRSDAAELSRLLSLDHLLFQDAAIAMPWSVLHACDVALAVMPGEAGLSMLWAQAMGVPIIAPMDDRLPMLKTLEQLVPARSSKPRDLADALTNWINTPSPQTIPR